MQNIHPFEQGIGKAGTIELQTRGPHPKIITFGKWKDDRQVSKEVLMRMKMRLNLSGAQTLQLRTAIRTVFGRHSVEAGAGDFQTELNHRVERYFKLVKIIVKKTHKGVETTVERPAVFCSDFDGLLQLLLEVRDIDADCEEVLIGFDDGQGFLKLMMLVQSTEDRAKPEKKRLKYEDGVFAGSFKNSGVKKLMPLVVVPDCQEQYENVKQILDLAAVKGVERVSESSDIKMVLTEMGKQRASCTHNCIFGDGKAPYTDGCRLITVGDLRRAYERYILFYLLCSQFYFLAPPFAFH